MATAEMISDHLSGWAPGTRHYRSSDGRCFAVEATEVPDGAETVVIERGESPAVDDLLVLLRQSRAALHLAVRPTVIFLTDESGQAIDSDLNDNDPMTPLHRFPAGTTHEAALEAAGYTLV